ncbi:MAG: class I SAM-dependent methyltransferase [Syntrophaceae bacterium]|nr:class I SAM-dependent methyltransferase [Syntrophaceae bacterium]
MIRETGNLLVSNLQRPAMWPEVMRFFVQRALRLIGCDSEETNSEMRRLSEMWCAERAFTNDEAFAKLGIGNHFGFLEKEALDQAKKRSLRCPLRMGGAGNLELIYNVCESVVANNVVETGVAYGWSSFLILLSLQKRPHARLFSVDQPYLRFANDKWVGIVVPPELRGQWTLYKMPDRKGVVRAIRDAKIVDLVHYDSDKTYKGRMRSYPLLWNALRKGGVFISDDIGDNPAFHDFCRIVDREPIVVRYENKYQGVIIKD